MFIILRFECEKKRKLFVFFSKLNCYLKLSSSQVWELFFQFSSEKRNEQTVKSSTIERSTYKSVCCLFVKGEQVEEWSNLEIEDRKHCPTTHFTLVPPGLLNIRPNLCPPLGFESTYIGLCRQAVIVQRLRFFYIKLKRGPRYNGRCRQVVHIQRRSLTQVWLNSQTLL